MRQFIENNLDSTLIHFATSLQLSSYRSTCEIQCISAYPRRIKQWKVNSLRVIEKFAHEYYKRQHSFDKPLYFVANILQMIILKSLDDSSRKNCSECISEILPRPTFTVLIWNYHSTFCSTPANSLLFHI